MCVCVCVNCHVCVLCRVQNSIKISAYYYWMATVIWSILVMFYILIPPFSMVWINILCFILAIFPSHINVLILCSISLNIWSGGFGRTVNGDINLGMTNVFKAVTCPCNVSFLCCHRFKQFLKSSYLGRRFWV